LGERGCAAFHFIRSLLGCHRKLDARCRYATHRSGGDISSVSLRKFDRGLADAIFIVLTANHGMPVMGATKKYVRILSFDLAVREQFLRRNHFANK